MSTVPAQARTQGRRNTRILVVSASLFGILATGFGLWKATSAWRTSPLQKGLAAYARGDWAEAAGAARLALREQPKNRDALRLLARSTGRQGREEIAATVFDQLGQDSLDAEDLFVLGFLLVKQGRNDVARTILELCRKRDPDHPEALRELARIYAASDRLADATELAKRLAKQPAWETRGLILLGLLHHEQSDDADAAEALAQALRRDPALKDTPQSPLDVRKLLVRALLMTGRHDDALTWLDWHPPQPSTPSSSVSTSAADPEIPWLKSRALLQKGKTEDAFVALEQAQGFGKDTPQAHEPSPYVGSSKCQECHKSIYQSQQKSRHAKTFHTGDDLAKLPLPDGPRLDPGQPEMVHDLRAQGDVTFTTRRGDQPQALQALVVYAFGSGDRGATPVGREPNGQWRELRLSYYGDVRDWDVTTGHQPCPNDSSLFLGEPMTDDALRRCIECHTTNHRFARDQAPPLAADRGIGCERCHGPGGHHVLAVEAAWPDPAIGRPKLASPDQVTRLCAQCHSPKGMTPSPSDPTSIRFQGTTMTWSKCYGDSGKALTCTSCHDPHRDAETSHAYYESKCLTCHSPKLETAAPAPPSENDKTRPIQALDFMKRVQCPVNPRSNCIECHMPTVTGALPHTSFTDHYIRVHRDQNNSPRH